jgi:predicted dithiol-disulfide oxidoreductase (DUF899 family)
MRQRERVAEMRRALPAGARVKQDYAFQEDPTDLAAGDEPARQVRLSELFTAPNRSLVIYHFMYGKAQKKACPMCTPSIGDLSIVVSYMHRSLLRQSSVGCGLPGAA